ncbi:MAG: cytochrome c1 [Alphaproteobacteria bacterium]|nr:cytochrome c1 [Alphaproteobacteria bacterium]
MRRITVTIVAAAALAAATLGLSPSSASAHEGPALEKQSWSWQGFFGGYDPAALKRGFQVYREVCSNCHSLRLLYYRNLSDPGGPGFSVEEVKKIAAEKEVRDGPNDAGDMFTRFARPSDHFAKPFANDNAARTANNGALPPDLSLIIKARNGGPDYVYNLLMGYKEAPPKMVINPGMQYNTVFPGNQIGMPPPVSEGIVTYADGTKATQEQVAKDIVSFLNWAAEPELVARHTLGLKVLGFLFVLTILFYALKIQIWKRVH